MPGGARGVRLKLKLTKVDAYAERLGWRREYRRRFNVMSHCGNNLSHSCIGKFGSSVAIPVRKSFLHVWIARSAAFRRCTCRGESWKVTWYFLKALRSSSLH